VDEKKKVLVVGATGMLGEPVARRLANDGYAVRILARDEKRARQIFAHPFEIFKGDIADINSIKEAMSDCFAVYTNLSGEIELTGTENVVAAALKSGIERLVHISGVTAFEKNTWYEPTRRKYLAEKAIINSGIPYTVFAPTWFMESLPLFVKEGRALYYGKQKKPFRWVAVDDYTRMVTKAMRLKEAENKKFFIFGPDKILFRDALTLYCAVLHPDIKEVKSLSIWFTRLIAAVKKSEQLKSIARFMSFFEKVGEDGDPAEAERILGKPETTLDMWLEKKRLSIRDNTPLPTPPREGEGSAVNN